MTVKELINHLDCFGKDMNVKIKIEADGHNIEELEIQSFVICANTNSLYIEA